MLLKGNALDFDIACCLKIAMPILDALIDVITEHHCMS
jgi:hypothetical protein